VSGIQTTLNELKPASVGSCVVHQVQQLRFLKPDGGICVKFRWPFPLSSPEDDRMAVPSNYDVLVFDMEDALGGPVGQPGHRRQPGRWTPT